MFYYSFIQPPFFNLQTKKQHNKKTKIMSIKNKIRGAYFIVSFCITASLADAPILGILIVGANFIVAAWQVNKIFEEEKQQ